MARTPKKVVAAKKAEDASPSKVAKTHKKEKGKLHRTKTMIEAAKEGREWIERQSRRKTNPTRARKAKKQAPNKELEKVPATLKPIPKKRPVKKAASKTHVKAKAEKLPNSIEKTSKNVAKLVKKPKAKLI